jgi:hypothetical protein
VTAQPPAAYRFREEVDVPDAIRTTVALSFVALVLGTRPPAGTAGQSPGRLSGVTQISFGCPGPQRVGQPCERWSSFAHARFLVTSLSGGARVVTSDGRGRFTVALAVGRYRLTPLRQAQTTGGTTLTVTIRAATTTWACVRFQGFPRML